MFLVKYFIFEPYWTIEKGGSEKVKTYINYQALGGEVEILFAFVVQSEVEGRQKQKDWNGTPARTPK